mmetsp:Transcript_57767/g.135878  ORF Transcript_57767/g.135878 Transcript_57767/m.135878 type:complete len:228 (-) Transcript_57767:305-988(-)
MRPSSGVEGCVLRRPSRRLPLQRYAGLLALVCPAIHCNLLLRRECKVFLLHCLDCETFLRADALSLRIHVRSDRWPEQVTVGVCACACSLGRSARLLLRSLQLLAAARARVALLQPVVHALDVERVVAALEHIPNVLRLELDLADGAHWHIILLRSTVAIQDRPQFQRIEAGGRGVRRFLSLLHPRHVNVCNVSSLLPDHTSPICNLPRCPEHRCHHCDGGRRRPHS